MLTILLCIACLIAGAYGHKWLARLTGAPANLPFPDAKDIMAMGKDLRG